MKKIKRLSYVIIVIFALNTTIQAMEISLGGSIQSGLFNSILRGDDFNNY